MSVDGRRVGGRRAKFTYRSIFDFGEVLTHFLEPKLLDKSQYERLVRTCALYPLADVDPNEAPDWQELTPNLPKAAYEKLEELNFRICTLKVAKESTSGRGDTKKLLVELQDGQQIETCIMRFGSDETSGHQRDEAGEIHCNSRRRATVCVSSQIGCRMGCTFCATGTLKLGGNLTCGEILEQILLANAVERRDRELEGLDVSPEKKFIRNVVFMGMGEPLDNYREVVRAVRILTSPRIISVAPYRVTISTVGYSPARIREMIRDVPRVSLALSLHAPTQDLRDRIVPTSKVNKLDKILEACYEFVDHQRNISQSNLKRQTLLVEYCVIANLNDSDDVAHELGNLLEPYKDRTMLNLIPYNKTDVGIFLDTPTPQRVTAFHNVIRGYNIPSFIRQEFGGDINGACGQLAAKTYCDSAIESSDNSVSPSHKFDSHMFEDAAPEQSQDGHEHEESQGDTSEDHMETQPPSRETLDEVNMRIHSPEFPNLESKHAEFEDSGVEHSQTYQDPEGDGSLDPNACSRPAILKKHRGHQYSPTGLNGDCEGTPGSELALEPAPKKPRTESPKPHDLSLAFLNEPAKESENQNPQDGIEASGQDFSEHSCVSQAEVLVGCEPARDPQDRDEEGPVSTYPPLLSVAVGMQPLSSNLPNAEAVSAAVVPSNSSLPDEGAEVTETGATEQQPTDSDRPNIGTEESNGEAAPIIALPDKMCPKELETIEVKLEDRPTCAQGPDVEDERKSELSGREASAAPQPSVHGSDAELPDAPKMWSYKWPVIAIGGIALAGATALLVVRCLRNRKARS